MANTSHIVQPLDGTPFATLKKQVKKARDNESLKRAVSGKSQHQVVSTILPQTEREAFTPEVIRSGFKDRGIWPFDKNTLLKRGELEYLNPSITTPAIQEAQQAFNIILERNKVDTPKKFQITPVKGIPEKNTLYTPSQLIQYDNKIKEKKENELKEKEEKKNTKEKEKKEKEELKEKEKQKREKEKKEKEKKVIEKEKQKEEKERQAKKLEYDEIRKNILPSDAKRQRNEIDYSKYERNGAKKTKL